MSQAGLIDVEASNPQIPTLFVTDSGDAIALGNVIEVLGGGTTTTSASGNTIIVTSSGGGTVTSVSGTLNRITSTGGAAPVIDISANYVGQSSITTLGTVTTGVWNGTTVGETFGGTGQSTYTTGDLLYASAANTLSKLAAASNDRVLTLVAGIPSWELPTTGTVTSVSGTLNRITSTGGATPVIDIDATYVGQTSITTLGTIATGVWNGTAIAAANGGTGANNAATTGTILRGNGTEFVPTTATYPSTAGTSGNVLTSDGTNWNSSAATSFKSINVQRFTASGAFTYTPTAGMQYVIVELVGGGGGSGGIGATVGNIAISQAAGGGAYAKFVLTSAQVGASLSGSVGVGGSAGAAGNNNGTAGGNTTLATTAAWSANGGALGVGNVAGTNTTVFGADGGTVTTGTGTLIAASTGGPGSSGTGTASTWIYGGSGGSSFFGPGGKNRGATAVSTVNSGEAGIAPGGGGSSAIAYGTNAAAAGGAGATGIAIFTEFLSV